MKIAVNGEDRRLDPGVTIAALLKDLDLEGKPVAVERNGRTVRKSDHATTALEDGDRIEVVTFVGGG
jgi:thiamine biosynthesis protein ThiS